ncbi:MAG: hypothetical protein QXS02_04535 [Candidatus Thermoplasmatota archaeon]
MYKDYKRIIIVTILFGSLWGFTECIIGSLFYDFDLPAGAIMAGFFALGLMGISRGLYQKRGMQFCMGMIAAAMRLFYPFGECFLCSAIAILVEGLIFELIWYNLSFARDLQGFTSKISLGVITGYSVYISGYVLTQILTPVVASAGFYMENLIVFMPHILARGLTAAVLGGLTLPLTTFIINHINIRLDDRISYPVSIGVSFLCWFSVILTTLKFIS